MAVAFASPGQETEDEHRVRTHHALRWEQQFPLHLCVNHRVLLQPTDRKAGMVAKPVFSTLTKQD